MMGSLLQRSIVQFLSHYNGASNDKLHYTPVEAAEDFVWHPKIPQFLKKYSSCWAFIMIWRQLWDSGIDSEEL